MKTIIFSIMLSLAVIQSASGQNLFLSLSGNVTDENSGAPVQNQTVNAEIIGGGLVQNYSYITNSNGFYGDSIPIFGQGSLNVSTMDCNGNIHSQSGTYSPNNCYFVFNFSICTDSITQGCQAAFSNEIMGNQTVAFFDMSVGNPVFGNPDHWLWDFGDGATSFEQNPVHVYNGFGSYLVCLTIWDDEGLCQSTWCDEINVGGSGGGCDNWFTYETNNNLEFSFLGYSEPPASLYYWDFGDGNTATGQNVTHSFNPGGVAYYIVTLTTMSNDPATGDSCFAYSSQEIWINEPGGCTNWFGFETWNNIDFAFFGESDPPASYYQWDFGDGSYDTGQTVMHSYSPNTGQSVMVTLTTFANDPATGDSCVAFSSQEIWLNGSGNGCENWFWYEQNNSFTFNFFGEAYPLPAFLYIWNFGDGQTAYGQQATHTYDPNAGDVFLVTLNTYSYTPDGDSCVAVSVQEVWVNGQGNGCENWFWYNNPSPYVFIFQGESFPVPANEYIWDFGDGTTDTGQTVTHTYEQGIGDVFLVTLTTLVYDPAVNDSCVAYSTQEVWIGGQGSDCQNWFWYESYPGFEFSFHGESIPFPAEQYIWQFDNGTVLFGQDITYTFDPSWGNEHLVCLTTYSFGPNGDSCSYTSCQGIILGGQTGAEIFGNVYITDSLPADYVLVGLFGMKPDGSFTYDFTVAEQGMYFFENVQPGDYYIFASLTPQSQFFFDYFPTYYGDAVTWSGATLITLGETQNPYNIHLVAVGELVSGSGVINGAITIAEGKGDPGTNITVILMDENENTLAFAQSDETGKFSFENLAYDIYKLKVEIPGKPSAIATVNLNEANPEGDVMFIIKEAEVTLNQSEFKLLASNCSELYPNPVSELASINLTLESRENLSIRIINQLGMVVKTLGIKLDKGSQVININTSDLKEGLYTLQITGETGGMLVKKFIK